MKLDIFQDCLIIFLKGNLGWNNLNLIVSLMKFMMNKLNNLTKYTQNQLKNQTK